MTHNERSAAAMRKWWRNRTPEQRAEIYRKRRAWRQGEKHAAARRREKLARYGLTEEVFNALRERQNFCCAICGTHERDCGRSKGKALVVDHCHDSRQVRALLCHQCNTGLGFMRESPEIMAKAIEYLNKHADLNKVAV